MKCPKCQKNSNCPCATCQFMYEGSKLKHFKFIEGDKIECPYCNEVTHVDNVYGIQKTMFNQKQET